MNFRQQFAGTQLWQNAMSIIVMDASNPKHVDIFKHDLEEHIKLKSETQTNENDQIIGYPKIKLDEKDEKSLSDVSKERTIETEDRTSEYVDVDSTTGSITSMTKILTEGEDIAKEVSMTKILGDDEGSAQKVSMTKILTDGEDIAKEVSMTKILGDDEGSAQEASMTKILTEGEDIAKEVSMTKILGDDEGSAQEVSMTKILTDGEDIAKEVSMTKILCDDECNAQEVSMTKILTDGEDIAKEVSVTKILDDDEGSAQEVSMTKILTDGEDIAKEVSMTKILGDDEGSAQEVSVTKILTDGEDIAKEVSMTKILGDDEGSAQEVSVTKILTDGENIAKEVSMTKILGDDEGSAQEVSVTKILTDGEDIAKEVSMTKILCDDEGNAQEVSMTKILTDGEDIAKEVSMTKILGDDEGSAQEVSMTKILTDGEDIAKEVSMTKILTDGKDSAQKVSMTKIVTDGEDIAKEVSVTKILTEDEDIAKEASMTRILGDVEDVAHEISATKILTDGEDIVKEISMTKILTDDEPFKYQDATDGKEYNITCGTIEDSSRSTEEAKAKISANNGVFDSTKSSHILGKTNGTYDSTSNEKLSVSAPFDQNQKDYVSKEKSEEISNKQTHIDDAYHHEYTDKYGDQVNYDDEERRMMDYVREDPMLPSHATLFGSVSADEIKEQNGALNEDIKATIEGDSAFQSRQDPKAQDESSANDMYASYHFDSHDVEYTGSTINAHDEKGESISHSITSVLPGAQNFFSTIKGKFDDVMNTMHRKNNKNSSDEYFSNNANELSPDSSSLAMNDPTIINKSEKILNRGEDDDEKFHQETTVISAMTTDSTPVVAGIVSDISISEIAEQNAQSSSADERFHDTESPIGIYFDANENKKILEDNDFEIIH
ncbi:unnamed protein product [Dracunculus medinensis]|uniref:Titin-like n=1 Tax=Dracunculus medinensis TaxID=318479 RepID=A0A0N4UDU4_DRAME|nr:unnamed protein product [Dracunculus medinensis]